MRYEFALRDARVALALMDTAKQIKESDIKR